MLCFLSLIAPAILVPSSNYSLKLLLTGNAEQGKAFFNGKGGCTACHSPQGDLAHVAQKYPPINLQARFLYPVGTPALATITLPTGEVIKGSLVHLDAFSVSITGQDGWYRSFILSGGPASRIKVRVEDPIEKHRQLITQYSNAELHDVFAYLETLQ
jgi:cytochrome c oxidase cbb3-type subunit 3